MMPDRRFDITLSEDCFRMHPWNRGPSLAKQKREIFWRGKGALALVLGVPLAGLALLVFLAAAISLWALKSIFIVLAILYTSLYLYVAYGVLLFHYEFMADKYYTAVHFSM